LLEFRFGSAPAVAPESAPDVAAIEAEALYHGTNHIEDPLHAQLLELGHEPGPREFLKGKGSDLRIVDLNKWKETDQPMSLS
jgi:hypothetical protein